MCYLVEELQLKNICIIKLQSMRHKVGGTNSCSRGHLKHVGLHPCWKTTPQTSPSDSFEDQLTFQSEVNCTYLVRFIPFSNKTTDMHHFIAPLLPDPSHYPSNPFAGARSDAFAGFCPNEVHLTILCASKEEVTSG